MFQFKNKVILILSPEGWGKNQLSKHLYAKELSKHNTVYFLHTTPHPQQQNKVKTTLIENNITLIHLNKVARGIFKLPAFAVDFQNKLLINSILKSINNPIDVVWSFDQSKFQNLKQFKATIAIFHPVDFIKKARPFLPRIANSADVVFSVSEKILEKINTTTPKHFINHGLDEIFITPQEESNAPEFIKFDKINVGYVGNLTMKLIDWDNLLKTVEENNQLNFVFIGPYQKSNLGNNGNNSEINKLLQLKNTTLTGSLTKKELVKSLPYFDLFWLCYNHKKYPIEVSNSHKILEYLSTGKVVISNQVSSYSNSSLLKMVNNNNKLSSTIKEVAGKLSFYNTTIKQEKRTFFAKSNSYSNHIKKIESIIIATNPFSIL